jgi:periplasmic copper chaperone A
MTHKRQRRLSLGCAAIAALALTWTPKPVPAADYDVGAIHITQPWARATPKGASAAAGYLTITNNGTAPDRLASCAAGDVAAQCQVHSMTMEGGVMKMRPVDGLEIKPGETVTLKPSSLHIMLTDLKRPLEQGKTATVTLQFEKAGMVAVEFPIVAFGAPAPGATTGGSMMMEGHGGMMQMDKH